MWNQVPIFWLRGWKRARETNVDTNVSSSLSLFGVFTMQRPVLLDSRLVEIESLWQRVSSAWHRSTRAKRTMVNDVRLDKAHKVSLVPIEKLVDGPRSKISSSGGRRNRLFSFNRCTVFTRVANRCERSNIREPVAESVGWSRTKPVEGN